MLIFDGDCAFCTSSARWIEGSWREDAIAVAWQQIGAATLERLGLTAEDCQEAAWWVEPSGELHKGQRAIGNALLAAGGWKKLAGRLILTRLVDPIAAVAYRVIAKYRHRLPGGTPACRIPNQVNPGDEGSRAPTL